MMTLNIILEKQEGEIWGRIETPDFLYTSSGENVEEITSNLRELVADFLLHEGKHLPQWEDVNINDISFEASYDLTAFFEIFSELKVGAIASRAGLNQALMRQYTSGVKYPSENQVKKIEDAIHQLGQILQQVSFA